MSRKTYRIKLNLDGGNKTRIYRTDGIPTHCCSLFTDYEVWERNTKHNGYDGWSGYISERLVKASLKKYNPDGLII